MDQKHPMVEHHMEEHRGQQVSCRFKVIKYHDRPLQRQAHEGFLIANFKGHKILNGRGDWGQNLPPRIMMEQDFYESKRQAEAQSMETEVKRQRLEAVNNQVAPVEATMPHLEPLEPPGGRTANNQGVHPEASGPPWKHLLRKGMSRRTLGKNLGKSGAETTRGSIQRPQGPPWKILLSREVGKRHRVEQTEELSMTQSSSKGQAERRPELWQGWRLEKY